MCTSFLVKSKHPHKDRKARNILAKVGTFHWAQISRFHFKFRSCVYCLGNGSLMVKITNKPNPWGCNTTLCDGQKNVFVNLQMCVVAVYRMLVV